MAQRFFSARVFEPKWQISRTLEFCRETTATALPSPPPAHRHHTPPLTPSAPPQPLPISPPTMSQPSNPPETTTVGPQMSYAEERALARGGAMEAAIQRMEGDDSAMRAAEAKRTAKRRIVREAANNKRMVLKTMLFENYEENLIDRRVKHGVVTDFGWKRMRRQRDQDHMTGDLPKDGVISTMLRRYKPIKNWPARKQLSEEEQALAILEGDTSATLKDGVALSKASSKVKTTLPMYYEGLRLHRVVQVSTGFGHTLILTAVGVVLSYGNNLEGQLGHGDQEKRGGASVIQALRGVTIVGVAAGLHHSCVISEPSQRKTFCFGKNDRGQLGQGDAKSLPRSTRPLLVRPIWSTSHDMEPAQVSAGENNIFFLFLFLFLFYFYF